MNKSKLQKRISILNEANMAVQNKDFLKGADLYWLAFKQTPYEIKLQIFFNLKIVLKKQIQINKNQENSDINKKIKIIEEMELIYSNFDTKFYLSCNPDVEKEGVDPVWHYCNNGWKEKRNPHPNFSTNEYLKVNEDVANEDLNPYWHWLKYGKIEGREVQQSQDSYIQNPYAQKDIFKNSEKLESIDKQIISIIIPIYNGYEDVLECLDRVDKYTSIIHQIILINDASPDERISFICNNFIKKRINSLLITNEKNLGFISSVNIGFSHTKGHVVILNTDAFVPKFWLERLMQPIIIDPNVASVTPMTNNGEIANIPIICKAHNLEKGIADKLDVIACQLSVLNTSVEIPTGVGFCMGIARDWLRKVPNFDPIFGRGYGEEVDWCQQVRKYGGKHILNGALFVEHRGGVSFGSEKKTLIEANGKIISEKYKTYDDEVQQFCIYDHAIGSRLALGLALISSMGMASVYLAHRLGGGADVWLNEEIAQKNKNKIPAIVIRDGDKKNNLLLELHFNEGITKGNILRSELIQYLKILKTKEVIYSCLVAAESPFEIIDLAVKNLTKKDRFKILIHDYYSICPSHTLVGGEEIYCGLPEITQCENCFDKMKPKYQRLSPNIINWRNQWAYYFNFADEIEVFSRSSNEILNKIYPQYSYKINIKPHKLIYTPKMVFIEKKSPIVIGVLGSIGYQKGAKILNELAQVAESKFKIVVIGEIDPAYSHPKIQIHGRFLRHEISDLTVKYSINKWFIPSICPETFSYTTHECIATGLRVYAFNIGAQADAASNYDSLSLIPLNSNIDFIVSILSESI